jgi:hypothetical protein
VHLSRVGASGRSTPPQAFAPALRHFPLRFEAAYAALSSLLFIRPEDSSIEVDQAIVHVRMGWGFRCTFPKSAVRFTSRAKDVLVTRGVHGWRGRWLVNGSGDGLLTIGVDPDQRAHVMGVPVSLRELTVSVDDPDALAEALME